MKRRNPNAAVSLLEVLIALMVMTMIAAIVASSIGFMGQVTGRIGTDAQAIELRLNERQLVRWLEDMPVSLTAIDQAVVSGTEQSVRFLTFDQSGQFWPGAPVEAKISWEDERLILEASGRAIASEDFISRASVVDIGVRNLRISFYGATQVGENKSWISVWDAEQAIPDLIKIEWANATGPAVPLVVQPGLHAHQNLRSLSSLVPPG